MSRKKLFAIFTAALLTITLGFFLPDLVGAIQRRALSLGSESVGSENIELYFSTMEFSEKLENTVTGTTEIIMDTGTRLTEEEAIYCAQDILIFLQETGFLAYDPCFINLIYTAQALYTVSYESLESFIQWRIALMDNKQNLEASLLLDDETGTLLAFSHLARSPEHEGISIQDVAIGWGMLYAEQTGMEFVGVYLPENSTQWNTVKDTYETTDLPEVWYLQFLQDDKLIQLIFLYQDGYYYFNV